MVSRSNTVSGRRSEGRQLAERVRRVEHRQRQLLYTLDAVAREAGLSVSEPCTKCGRCYTLVKNGMLYCPSCGRTCPL